MTKQKLLLGAKNWRYIVYVEKSVSCLIVLSAVMILSLACSALAVGQSGRYIGNSTVNGSIYQTYYQVDAQTRTGIKSISVSGTLYEKGTFGTWQRVSTVQIQARPRTAWQAVTTIPNRENLTSWSIPQHLIILMDGVKLSHLRLHIKK